MSQALVAALARLLEGAGPAACRASAFTPAQRQALSELARSTGAIKVITQGRGNVYQVVNAAQLAAHLHSLRPQRADALDPSLPRRAANIAQARNSKTGAHGHDLHYLLLKSISEDVVWHETSRNSGSAFDLSATTQAAGAGVLALQESDGWRSEQPLWLVENQALFDRLDWLPKGAQGSVAYYAGQLPGRLLTWLAARPRAPQVVIFPDYDGVGLLNYARLLAVCASPCSFWLMPDWPSRLSRYGSQVVWQNTLPDFQSAWPRLGALGAPAEVLALCEALSRQGLALEHETVWLQAAEK